MLNLSVLTASKLPDTLHDIVKGCIEGKRIAQEQLYKLFSPKMYAVCLRYCQDSDEAKDILQDGFIKVFEKIYQIKNIASIEGWIRRIMVNTALEYFRRRPMNIFIDQLPDIKEEEPEEPYFELSSNDLLNLVNKLPTRYRMVFNLYVFEEMSHKEVAEALDITEGTSKSDLSRARAILQNKIYSISKKVVNLS
jgi:RNA polymerase sigma-70 factor (ECF subfamily)